MAGVYDRQLNSSIATAMVAVYEPNDRFMWLYAFDGITAVAAFLRNNANVVIPNRCKITE